MSELNSSQYSGGLLPNYPIATSIVVLLLPAKLEDQHPHPRTQTHTHIEKNGRGKDKNTIRYWW